MQNKDLWLQLNAILKTCAAVHFKWVKAHATSTYNNAVDRLARNKALSIQADLPTDFTPPVTIIDSPQKSLF